MKIINLVIHIIKFILLFFALDMYCKLERYVDNYRHDFLKELAIKSVDAKNLDNKNE